MPARAAGLLRDILQAGSAQAAAAKVLLLRRRGHVSVPARPARVHRADGRLGLRLGVAAVTGDPRDAQSLHNELRQDDGEDFQALVGCGGPFMPSADRDRLALQLKDANVFQVFAYDAQREEGGGWV